MVYVTFDTVESDEPSALSFGSWGEAEDFCKENKLNTEECCCEMNW